MSWGRLRCPSHRLARFLRGTRLVKTFGPPAFFLGLLVTIFQCFLNRFPKLGRGRSSLSVLDPAENCQPRGGIVVHPRYAPDPTQLPLPYQLVSRRYAGDRSDSFIYGMYIVNCNLPMQQDKEGYPHAAMWLQTTSQMETDTHDRNHNL